MFISDTERQKNTITKGTLVYLAISLFCAVFGAIYHQFSHDVYSAFMTYAFLFPLVGGALPFAIMTYTTGCPLPGRLPFNLYNSGIAALTTGSLFQGVLEIYGTTNRLSLVYWYVGGGFVFAGILLYGFGWIACKRRTFRKT